MSDRLSPLHEAHVAAGATFTDFAGWQMPVRYSSDLAEHKAVREAAGLFDLSHMGEIVLVGPEAAAALDYAVSGTMSKLPLGRAKYTHLLSPQGTVIDDLIVYRTGDDRFLVVANASNALVVAEALRARASAFDTEVYDESDDVALIAIQGPKALEILGYVEGFAIDHGHATFLGTGTADFEPTLAKLGYYRCVGATYEGHPVLIARTGYTGEDGFELFCAPDFAQELWDALLEVGAGSGLVPAGLAARDTLRLEAGMPLYGHELGLDAFPAQAGLGGIVDLAKPVDFIGRAASEDGPSATAPVLVGLIGEGKRAARAEYAIYASGSAEADEAIGVVTSGALSPTLGHPIAMAYVKPGHNRPGTIVEVDIRGTRTPYTVTTLPFYTREKN